LILPYRTTLLLSVGLAAVLACSGAALAAPAGDEYLPKVPSAGGNAAPAKGGDLNSGSGETGTGGSSTGTSETGTGTGATKAKGDQDKNGKKSDKDDSTTPAAATDSNSSGGGGSSGLIVLALIGVAVIVVAGGMILRHRAGLSEDEGEDRGKGRGPGGTSARPTPDGEIVAGREKI
jgi:cobalamin biosynthesis Mg chelatase CobN